ncbi:hypothetical protein J6590_043068 [Homalodisca vitripennis]|nr:hypothetical protein J6590_043068 [Homalodisca vitripennis]
MKYTHHNPLGIDGKVQTVKDLDEEGSHANERSTMRAEEVNKDQLQRPLGCWLQEVMNVLHCFRSFRSFLVTYSIEL